VKRVVVTAHLDPDPDGLGCALGLAHVLRREGWNASAVCIGHEPSFAASLPGYRDLLQFPSRVEPGHSVELLLHPGDALIVADTPTPTRMGAFFDVHQETMRQCAVIVFDHHVTNEQYGDLNLVDPSAAATAEVVCGVMDANGMALDAESATCFMAALLADTLGFRTESTSPRSLLLGYRLTSAGAPIFALSEMLFKMRPAAALKLWGLALGSLCVQDRLAWTAVTQEMLRSTGATLEDTEGLVEFLLGSRDVDVAIVLKEQRPGETRVSMRTVPGIDATRVVGVFGGGGHQRAAGCTIEADPAAAAALLVPLAIEEMRARALAHA
jgi:phosphoesterase RecJ-like protein